MYAILNESKVDATWGQAVFWVRANVVKFSSMFQVKFSLELVRH